VKDIEGVAVEPSVSKIEYVPAVFPNDSVCSSV
jgi:hypothetical protein